MSRSVEHVFKILLKLDPRVITRITSKSSLRGLHLDQDPETLDRRMSTSF